MMRFFAFAACLALLATPAAIAQTAPAPAYSTESTDLGTLLDNPDTKPVLQKHIPELISSEQIDMARSMTLKALQQYAGPELSDAKLAEIDADLIKIAPKK